MANGFKKYHPPLSLELTYKNPSGVMKYRENLPIKMKYHQLSNKSGVEFVIIDSKDGPF